MSSTAERFTSPQGRAIAFRQLAGKGPGVMFLGGFRSNMASVKVTSLLEWCRTERRNFVCFDYSGHGDSSGRFEQGSIGDWLEDAIAVFEHTSVDDGPRILVGSSMGGWIALLLALQKRQQVAGVLTLACAADFLTRILIPHLNEAHRRSLEREGVAYLESDYEEAPYPIGRRLLDEAGRFEILDRPIALDCPVELIHGLDDRHIPWETSLETLRRLDGCRANLTLVKDANHRLSRPQDLQLITDLLARMIRDLSGGASQ